MLNINDEDFEPISKELEDRLTAFYKNPKVITEKRYDYDGKEIKNIPECNGFCEWCLSIDACETYCEDLDYYHYEHYQGWYSNSCGELVSFANEANEKDKS